MTGLSLNNRFRVVRAVTNLSRRELADWEGVSRQTLSSIEGVQYCPLTALAIHFTVNLGRRFEDFFNLEEVSSWRE
jgi:putative transcriptional regulator